MHHISANMKKKERAASKQSHWTIFRSIMMMTAFFYLSFLSGVDREHCWQLDNREANLPMKDRSLFRRQTGSCLSSCPTRDYYIEKYTHTGWRILSSILLFRCHGMEVWLIRNHFADLHWKLGCVSSMIRPYRDRRMNAEQSSPMHLTERHGENQFLVYDLLFFSARLTTARGQFCRAYHSIEYRHICIPSPTKSEHQMNTLKALFRVRWGRISIEITERNRSSSPIIRSTRPIECTYIRESRTEGTKPDRSIRMPQSGYTRERRHWERSRHTSRPNGTSRRVTRKSPPKRIQRHFIAVRPTLWQSR